MSVHELNPTQPTEIYTNDISKNGFKLMEAISVAIHGWGLEVSDPVLEYEPTWGEGRLKIEVKQGD